MLSRMRGLGRLGRVQPAPVQCRCVMLVQHVQTGRVPECTAAGATGMGCPSPCELVHVHAQAGRGQIGGDSLGQVRALPVVAGHDDGHDGVVPLQGLVRGREAWGQLQAHASKRRSLLVRHGRWEEAWRKGQSMPAARPSAVLGNALEAKRMQAPPQQNAGPPAPEGRLIAQHL